MRTTVVDGMRPCSVCKVYLPNTGEYFHRYAVTCKLCASARAKQYVKDNRERVLALRANYRKLHPTPPSYWLEYRRRNSARLNAHSHVYFLANREKWRADSRRRYRADPGLFKAQIANWCARSPEKVRANIRAKNHRRRGVALNPEAAAYTRILVRDPCSYCGRRFARIEIDHIQPVSKGGSGEWTNLTAACRRCNNRKSARSLLEFIHV